MFALSHYLKIIVAITLLNFFAVPSSAQDFDADKFMVIGRSNAAELEWSPDGDEIAIGTLNSGVWVYNSSFEDIAHYAEGNIEEVEWSPSENWIGILQQDGTFQVVDRASGAVIFAPAYEVLAFAWQPIGDLLALSDKNNNLIFWNRVTGHTIDTLQVNSRISKLAWHPKGDYLATFDRDDQVSIWDIPNKRLIHTLESRHTFTHKFKWNIDGTQLAIVAENDAYANSISNLITVWDTENYQLHQTLIGEPRDIRAIDWSSTTTNILVSADSRGAITSWDTMTGLVVTTIREAKPTQIRLAAIFDIDISIDNKLIAADFSDSTVKVWDMESGELLNTYKGHNGLIRSMAWSRDGRQIATGGSVNDPYVRIWDVTTGALTAILEGQQDSIITSLDWDASGFYLASGSSDGTIRIWDTTTYEQTALLVDINPSNQNKWSVRDIAWHPRESLLASSSSDAVRIWDVSDERIIAESMKSFTTEVTHVMWNIDGTQIITLENKSVKIRNAATLAHLVTSFDDQTYRATTLDKNPITEQIIIGSTNGLTIIDIASAQVVRQIEGYHASWHPDGMVLAISKDKEIKIVEVTDSETLITLVQRSPTLYTDLRWSPDGSYLAAISENYYAVYVWEV